MKVAAILSLLALGVNAKLEADFQKDVIEGGNRDLRSCCRWVCDEESSPSYYYVSKAGMKGRKGGYYSRRTEETTDVAEQPAERELPGKGFGGGGYGYGYGYGYGHGGYDGDCYWDCDCDYGGYGYGHGGGMIGGGYGYGHGYMCFPTYTDSDDCDCTCCGHIPPPMIPEPEEPEESSSSYYYVSKAGMKGRKGGYYSRRTEETKETQEVQPEAERELWGGMGGGYHWGPSITCNCDCDTPSPRYYVSKAGMKGRKGGYYGGSGYDDYY